MRVSIMQPAFLPWLGYFDRLLKSDLHIVLNHVQIDRNSKTKFVNRNRIRTKDGSIWLTVPISTKGLSGQLEIDRIKIVGDHNWGQKMWRSIEINYASAPHLKDFGSLIYDLLTHPDDSIAELNRRLTDVMRNALGIHVPTRYSREMGVDSRKNDLILELCMAVSATTYISGPFGRDYLDEQKFSDAGITVEYHDYVHPAYRQAYPGFEPYMSAIDLILNHGPGSRAILEPQTAPITA